MRNPIPYLQRQASWPNGAPPRPTITQEMLEEYQQVQRRFTELERQKSELRERLLALHEQSAPIEQGPFELNITTQESRRFSYETVTAVVGRYEADRIRDEMPRTVARRVEVRQVRQVGGRQRGRSYREDFSAL